MNKEPTVLYLFRLIIIISIFAFLGMLYWSSSLQEQRLLEIQQDLKLLKKEMQGLSVAGNSTRPGAYDAFAAQQTFSAKERPHIDPSLPNLLKEDLFYTNVLPKLLPEGFTAKGMRRDATVGKPHNLHPFTNWVPVASIWGLCSGAVARAPFGKYEGLVPDLAIKIEERISSSTGLHEFWVHLREGIFWHPLDPNWFPRDFALDQHFTKRHPVTAQDFKFYFDALMNPFVEEAGAEALRNYLGDIEEFRVIDPLTFVVRWKHSVVTDAEGKPSEKIKYAAKILTGALKPLPGFVYQYFPDGSKIIEKDSDPQTYRNNSVWAQNFSQHWAKNIVVSCGPWIFTGMDDAAITLKRNPDYHNPRAVLVEEMKISFRESPDAIWLDFKAGKIDSYALRPEQLVESELFLASEEYQKQKQEKGSIHRIDYISRAYAYVGWNQANPLFSSRKVRQAMTMAIDRDRIIQQNLNNMGISVTGPFFRGSSSYDPTIDAWPYDPQRSRQLLEEEGWYDADGDGIREKMIDGKVVPFIFTLTYYVKSPTAKASSEYIQSALKEIGVVCNLNGIDLADISNLFDEKSFDALLLAWALGTPPEEPKQLWHSSGAREKGSSNAVGFTSEEADRIIEELQYEYDEDKRQELYHRFHALIHEEAPYTFLYTPKSVLLYRDWVKNVWIPSERQDLVPGANVAEPDSSVWWLEER